MHFTYANGKKMYRRLPSNGRIFQLLLSDVETRKRLLRRHAQNDRKRPVRK